MNAACGRCQQQRATIYLVDITDGEKREFYMCQSCADAINLPAVALPLSVPRVQSMPQPTCKQCGWTMTKFMKTGRLGCPEDYNVFSQWIDLSQYHGSDQHVGKVPQSVALEQEKKDLQTALNNAVKSEAYEDAAKIRDLIRELERSNEETT